MRLAFAVIAVAVVWSLQAAAVLAPADDEQPDWKDFTNVSLESLKITPVEAGQDARTGFLVGGANSSSLISGLKEINGRPIAELEGEMRPGASSTEGFLGADEKLLEVLAEDNDYVTGTLHRTHQELALQLRIMAAIGLQGTGQFLYHGRRFKISFVYSRGYQDSPFHDGTRASAEATIVNLATGKRLQYSLLVPDMIERYGFYEGKGTPFRVDPKRVAEVLDFLKGKS